MPAGEKWDDCVFQSLASGATGAFDLMMVDELVDEL